MRGDRWVDVSLGEGDTGEGVSLTLVRAETVLDVSLGEGRQRAGRVANTGEGRQRARTYR